MSATPERSCVPRRSSPAQPCLLQSNTEAGVRADRRPAQRPPVAVPLLSFLRSPADEEAPPTCSQLHPLPNRSSQRSTATSSPPGSPLDTAIRRGGLRPARWNGTCPALFFLGTIKQLKCHGQGELPGHTLGTDRLLMPPQGQPDPELQAERPLPSPL